MKKPTLEDRLRARNEAPAGRQVMHQQWRRLLFLHWSVEPAALQATLPPGLTIDTHDGRAWLGVVPFFMRGIRPVYLPPVPGVSDFLELNVRSYVHDDAGRPGVWFYSLDANQWLAVKIARTFFKLPYHRATMCATVESDAVNYTCRRGTRSDTAEYRWQLSGEPFEAEPGSLDSFLAERYLLFAWNEKRRRLSSGRVVHTPYPLRQATVETHSTLPIAWDGLSEPTTPPEHVVGSDGVDVAVYPLTHV